MLVSALRTVIDLYRMPASFGGRKNSGYGRESGADAIYDMQIKKTIWTSNSRVTEDPFKIR